MSNILLVEPSKSKVYHSPYPPLGLLKIAAFHKQRKNNVKLVQGKNHNGFSPDTIYITSLFTYAFEPVHDVIDYYCNTYKKSKIIVGGIYATLCSDHLEHAFKDRIEIFVGLNEEFDDILPDYSLVPQFKTSLIFSSRGCIRKCPFCSVSTLEPEFKAKKSIMHLIYPGHKKVILWDNNILASPYWENIFKELHQMNLEVDFNQGLDARILNEAIANRLTMLKLPIVRLAYDSDQIRDNIKKSIEMLKRYGVRGRNILVYCLYNHSGTPNDFFYRIRDVLEWGAVAYPMRYEPLKPMKKNSYVSEEWTATELEIVADARRVLGYGGAFPPYDGLRKKFLNAKCFDDAFKLNAPRSKKME